MSEVKVDPKYNRFDQVYAFVARCEHGTEYMIGKTRMEQSGGEVEFTCAAGVKHTATFS